MSDIDSNPIEGINFLKIAGTVCWRMCQLILNPGQYRAPHRLPSTKDSLCDDGELKIAAIMQLD